ncbi:MAG TPA: VWA domain-containing protein [Bryobacteraceae bacterium]|nr:VWA domain-containing protein [Bryobacteraceae bacterium]
MKYLKAAVLLTLVLLLTGIRIPLATAQQGPQSQPSETVAKPKKKDVPADTTDTTTNPDQPKIPSQYKKDKDTPSSLPTFHSDVTAVQIEVSVLDNKGHFIPNIPKDRFRVLEDNIPQQISTFSTNADAPMTIAMVIEFSNLFQRYYSQGWYETLQASYGFVQTLKPDDYLAVIAFDMHPEILSDFTTDRMKTQEAMQRLRIPGFSESNMFDAVVDTVQRMSNIEGRKAILLIATGRDTFSKLTFDKARKAIQEGGVPIYAISILQALRIMAEQRMGPLQRMDFLQADNEMNTFARETGGQAFFPRFLAEYPGIYNTIAQALRNQYSIAYHPSNQAKDGKYRKIKVELVNPENGEALKIVDEKHKPIKYSVIAKGGYTAPREVE